MPLLEIRGLIKRFIGVTAVDQVDLSVERGELVSLIGPNGSGKTTLLSVAAMSLWPTAGTVEVLGATYGKVDAREHRRRIGMAAMANAGLTAKATSPAPNSTPVVSSAGPVPALGPSRMITSSAITPPTDRMAFMRP